VLDSYPVIGAVFGEEVLTIAQRRQQELIDKLNEFEAKTKRRKPLRTLICLDRSRGTGRIQNLWIAGTDSFLNEVLVKAGGENVAKFTRQYGTEGIIHLAPDVIIDLYIDGKDSTQSESDWQSLGNSIPAIKNHRILTLTDDFAPVPGTRTPILIEKIVRYFESIEL
jgi:ABC-type Fe3+-hydroxamate transport system substrate-binding protein